ncbi:hypothetical protein [Sanguibacter sp. HDW7]|uniref:hypothetical protein n=1 Tax=Sanguibacter sp. HDW7 TaxID=2714931 RepID=UPI001407B3AC|nr:hypothetical protein [Sanguibacter sp. HDW7]QIK83973.1 hypothetical protein G7063_10345 [Sanguibacter sp. HDW7]
MLQRVIGWLLVALGVLSAALGVASATVWRPDDLVTASSSGAGATTLLAVEPGVLDLVSDDVTVTATRPDGGEITVALGREVDVRGWVGSDAHLSVTGLATWDRLATTLVAGETTPLEPADGESTKASDDKTTKPSDDKTTKPADDGSAAATPGPATVVGTSGLVGPDPSGSDMWFASATGAGSATLPVDVPAGVGRTMLLVASVGDGAPAPVLALAWQREVATPWLVPALVVGILLLLAGGLVLLAATRGGLLAVGATARRSILETSARTAATLSTRRDGRRADTPAEPPAPATPAGTVSPTSTTTRTADPAASAPSTSSPYGPRPVAPSADSASVLPGMAVGATRPPAPASPYAVRRSAPSAGSATDQGTDAASLAATAPAGAGGRPLTRREMREQAEREAALAAQEKARRRPRTGTLPVVRAARSAGETVDATPAPPPATSPSPPAEDAGTARADAWRRAWGFEQQTWSPSPQDQSPTNPEEDA